MKPATTQQQCTVSTVCVYIYAFISIPSADSYHYITLIIAQLQYNRMSHTPNTYQMNPQHHHVSTPRVTVSTTTTSSSSSSSPSSTTTTTTLTRKRRLSSITQPQQQQPWNDPSFRSSCKKRFLENATAFSAAAAAALCTPPHRSIDLLRHVVRDELQQLLQSRDNTSNNNNTTQQSSSGRDHSIPNAPHYLDDDELYDLLLEMEQEFRGGNSSSEPSGTTTTRRSSANTVVFMTDWEEDMYYHQSLQQQEQYENDAVQDQIMDYEKDWWKVGIKRQWWIMVGTFETMAPFVTSVVYNCIVVYNDAIYWSSLWRNSYGTTTDQGTVKPYTTESNTFRHDRFI